MFKLKRLLACSLLLSHIITANAQGTVKKYRCMIQMNSYLGEGAYIVVSLVNNDGSYNQTLYVLGDDRKWYPDLKEWHKAYSKKPANISAITGASVTGGDRTVITIEIDDNKINAGYKLRFESAVEKKGYHVTDAEVPLSTEGLGVKTEGTGFIRYVRFSGN